MCVVLKHMQAQIPSNRFISSCKHMKIPRDYEVDSKWTLLKHLPLQELLSTWMSLSPDVSSPIFLFGTVKAMQDSLLGMQLFCR